MSIDISNGKKKKELILTLIPERHQAREKGWLAEKSESVVSKFFKKFCETGCEGR